MSLKDGIFQVPLQLRFESGSSIAFFTKGGSKHQSIHLTGYKLQSSNLPTSLVKVAPLHMSTPHNSKKLNQNSSDISSENKKTPHSILVSERNPKVEGQEKKRVSIKETPTRIGKEDQELKSKIQEILNGGVEEEEDDDDEFEDDEELDDFDEVIELEEEGEREQPSSNKLGKGQVLEEDGEFIFENN